MYSMKANEKILASLSRKDVKENIEASIKDLKEIYPEMAGLDYLAVAPSLKSRPNAILILAMLKEGSYIISEMIKDSIESWTESEGEKKIFVLNSADLERMLKNERIDLEEYKRLKYCCIELEDFNVQTVEELQEQFEKNYLQRSPAELGVLPQDLKDFEINPPPVDEDGLDNGVKKAHEILLSKNDLSREVGELVRMKSDTEEQKEASKNKRMEREELQGEEDLPHLRELAEKDYHYFSREECQFLLRDLEDVEIEGNQLLHHIVKNWRAAGEKGIGSIMAVIKYLLGVHPKTKNGNEIKVSFAPIIDNINTQDELGRTVLHIGADAPGGILYWLLKLKADPLVKDLNGKTFLEYIPSEQFRIKKEIEQFVETKFKIEWDESF